MICDNCIHQKACINAYASISDDKKVALDYFAFDYSGNAINPIGYVTALYEIKE